MAVWEGQDASTTTDRAERSGNGCSGSLLDRAHTMPPQLIAPLIAQEIAAIGGRDVTVLLQDYDQMTLVPLPGEGLVTGKVQPIDDSLAGLAFQTDEIIERPWGEVVRLYIRCSTVRTGSVSWCSPSTTSTTTTVGWRAASPGSWRT